MYYIIRLLLLIRGKKKTEKLGCGVQTAHTAQNHIKNSMPIHRSSNHDKHKQSDKLYYLATSLLADIRI